MKIYLDDERPCPEGWHLCRTFDELVHLVDSGCPDGHAEITEISLDHDLGTDKTGYDFITWFEQQHHDFPDHYPLPKNGIKIHSANPVGRQRMQQVIDKLYRKNDDE
jgi:hypothetical protein